MLKRQRASTPPIHSDPSSSAATTSYSSYNPSFVDVDDDAHAFKRRRTAAPTLDGRLRSVPRDEDEDEDYYEEEDSELIDEEALEQESMQPQLHESKYKGVNMLLHQLHFEHQRRLAMAAQVFSPPSSSSSSSPSRAAGAHLSRAHQQAMHYYDWNDPPSSEKANHIEQALDSDAMDATSEMEEVRCRYEKTNRCVILP
jgi:hypothetical protein